MPYSIYAFLADALLALILLLGIGLGWRRGFIRTVAKPVKLVSALILSFNLCTPVAERWLQPMLEAPIKERMSAYLTEKCAHLTAANAAEELPTLLKLAAGLFDIDITEVAEGAGAALIDRLVTSLATPVAHVIAIVFAFVGVYIVSQLLLTVALWLLNAIFRVGVLGVANRIVGLLFGALFAMLIAWGAVALCEFALGLGASGAPSAIEQVRGGVLYGFFDKYSPLDLLLSF